MWLDLTRVWLYHRRRTTPGGTHTVTSRVSVYLASRCGVLDARRGPRSGFVTRFGQQVRLCFGCRLVGSRCYVLRAYTRVAIRWPGTIARELVAFLRVVLSLSPGAILGMQAVFRQWGNQEACEHATLSNLSRCDADVLDGSGPACTFFGNDFASVYIVCVNMFVIGATSVYAVFRFVGVLLCVVLSMLIKARQFSSATQLRSDRDVIAWHEQFTQLQASVAHVSKTMLQWPLTVVLALALGLTLGLFSYTFVSTEIFEQPLFYELVLLTLMLTAGALSLMFFTAQVSFVLESLRMIVAHVGSTQWQVATKMREVLMNLQDQHLRTVGLLQRLQKYDINKDRTVDTSEISAFLLRLMKRGALMRQVRVFWV